MNQKSDSSSVLSYVALTLKGDLLLPDVISDRLGTQPTKGFARGDAEVHPEPTSFGYWRLRLDRTTESLEELLKMLLDSVVTSELRILAEEFETEIVLVMDLSGVEEGEVTVAPELLLAIGRAKLSFRLYWLYDADAPEPADHES
jgi:hypothetical protein